MSEGWPETGRIESIEGFAKWLSESIASGNDTRLVFRGQSDSEGHRHLQPSLDRILPKDPKDWLAEEVRIAEDFHRQAFRFLGHGERWHVGKTTTACMTVMQHFGAPTRLLDWTYSPEVAAYFACIHEPNKDGTIWWIDSKAVEHFCTEHWVEWGFKRYSEDPREEIDLDARIFEPNVPTFVTLVRHRFPFPRVRVQQGLFTMGSQLGMNHDTVLKEQVSERQRGRTVIEAHMKVHVLDCLEQREIDAVSLQYAGADRVGLRMAWDLEQKR